MRWTSETSNWRYNGTSKIFKFEHRHTEMYGNKTSSSAVRRHCPIDGVSQLSVQNRSNAPPWWLLSNGVSHWPGTRTDRETNQRHAPILRKTKNHLRLLIVLVFRCSEGAQLRLWCQTADRRGWHGLRLDWRSFAICFVFQSTIEYLLDLQF